MRSPVGFYWRKLIFFACFFYFALIAYTQVNYFLADTYTYTPAVYTSELIISMRVEKDGAIYIDDKKSSERVNVSGSLEEIRFPVIDNPGQYYDSVKIILTLPKDVAYDTKHELKGIHGVESVSSNVQSANEIVFLANEVQSTAILSIVAEFPAKTVNPPLIFKLYSFLNSLKSAAWLILGTALPMLTALYLLLFISYQIRRQKVDLPQTDTTAPPMAIPPAIVGVLFRQKVGPREIAATLIDLALRGDITILDRERDFAFAKNKFDQRLLSYEKVLLSKIFREGLVSRQQDIEERLNSHLYSKKISAVTAGMYALSTRLGYFNKNPHEIHQKYQLIGVVGTIIGLVGIALSLLVFQNPPYILFFWIGMTISTLIISVTAKNIPIRSVLGQEALSNWLAFRNFLSKKEKMSFNYENQEIFQRYLPYAIVLDCEVAWAKRFSEESFIIPDWFISARGGMGMQDFCLSLFPIVSYVSRSLAAIREPGFK